MRGPTDIDNWEDFVQAFEQVFHNDWTTTLEKLPGIKGTFLQPASPEVSGLWKSRDALLDAYHKLKPALELAIIGVRELREETRKFETWITGVVSSNEGGLFFQTDQPIEGNSTQNLVLLGVQRGLEKSLLPLYCKAAEEKMTLRLYGVLVPTEELLPYQKCEEGTPSMCFVTWKCHLPSDPDEIPQSEKLLFKPEDRFSEFRVKMETDSQSLTLIETVMQEFELLQHHPRSCIVIMHGFIELLINTLIEAKCKEGQKMVKNNRDYPHSIKLTLLYELGVLSEDEFKNLNLFRKLRNDAAHEAVFTITNEKAKMFVGSKFTTASQFPLLCMDIFMNLWNNYCDIFAPKFSREGYVNSISSKPTDGRFFKFK